jgi:hypothetical protein
MMRLQPLGFSCGSWKALRLFTWRQRKANRSGWKPLRRLRRVARVELVPFPRRNSDDKRNDERAAKKHQRRAAGEGARPTHSYSMLAPSGS